jgi:hypothetical protein
VVIRHPDGPPLVDTGQLGPDGEPLLVACSRCHVAGEGRLTADASALDEFHQGLTYDHGARTCLSCHNDQDMDTLRLADGRALPYERTMELCGQCHGPQLRDYRRGSHGGMTGYWDLSRGGRRRNHCMDCHDPHHPAYQSVLPVFAPRDRFLPGAAAEGDAHE